MKIWDSNKKKIIKELETITRLELANYQVIVLHPSMETCLRTKSSPTIAWGKKKDLENPVYTMLQIIFQMLKSKIS